MVRDTPPSQGVPTHQIWISFLEEYRRYAPDTKRDGQMYGRTEGQCDYYITEGIKIIAISKVMVIHLVKLLFNWLKK